MRCIIVLLIFNFLSCAKNVVDEFDSLAHCMKFQQCFISRYKNVSVSDFKLCFYAMTEKYERMQVVDKNVLDAFYTDCKELDACTYESCFNVHRVARFHEE